MKMRDVYLVGGMVLGLVVACGECFGGQVGVGVGVGGGNPSGFDVKGLVSRLEASDDRRVIVPVVVIVENEQSYIEAIGSWGKVEIDGKRAAFPVLIDDQTFAGREDIARFVRAFKPTRVVRWVADVKPIAGSDDRWGRMNRAVYRAFGAEDQRGMMEALKVGKAGGAVGVVAAHPDDSAWSGGLALAAFAGQAMVKSPKVGKAMGWPVALGDADDLSSAIRAGLTEQKIAFAGLGDEVDLVTVALNCVPSVKVEASSGIVSAGAGMFRVGVGETVALADLIGRDVGGSRGTRWGFSSQIVGSVSQAAYRAMCALFLENDTRDAKTAFVVDGYKNEGAFGLYDGTKAGQNLASRGFASLVLDEPNASAEKWRDAVSGGLSQRLVLLNSSGNKDFFDMNPGRLAAEDVPTLGQPAVVHMVHSWSFEAGGDASTVGGRWIDNGAYVYVGSVFEPYLQAFVPTPVVAARLVEGWPMSIACRKFEGVASTVWRVGMMGDATWRMTRKVQRGVDGQAIAGLLARPIDLEMELAQKAKNRDMNGTMNLLNMLGQDDKAARLGSAFLAESSKDFSTFMAWGTLMPAARTGRVEEVARFMVKVDNPQVSTRLACDALWQGARGRLASGELTSELVDGLKASARPGTFVRDISELSRAMAKTMGNDAARAMVQSVISKAPNSQSKVELERLMGNLR